VYGRLLTDSFDNAAVGLHPYSRWDAMKEFALATGGGGGGDGGGGQTMPPWMMVSVNHLHSSTLVVSAGVRSGAFPTVPFEMWQIAPANPSADSASTLSNPVVARVVVPRNLQTCAGIVSVPDDLCRKLTVLEDGVIPQL
jgi:hypothetical protein